MCGNCDNCGHCSFADVTSYFSGFNGEKSGSQLGSNIAYGINDYSDPCLGRTKVTILTYYCITTSTYSATTKIFDVIFFKINTTLMSNMIFFKNVELEKFFFLK
jgi:hypothetical protein